MANNKYHHSKAPPESGFDIVTFPDAFFKNDFSPVLQKFVEFSKLHPSILHNREIKFFREYLESLGATIPLLHTKNRKSTTTTTISKNVSSSREEAVSPKNKETSMEKGTPVELVVSKADFSKIQKYEVATVTAPSKKGKRKRKVLYDSWLSEYSSSVSDVDSPKKPKRVTQEPGLMNRMEQSEERVILEPTKRPQGSSTPTKTRPKTGTKTKFEFNLSPNDSIFNASFDTLKRPEKPKGEVVVRTKAERRKLHGHELSCCKPYFDALDLSPTSRERRVNEVSKHRTTYHPFRRVPTPEHFWETDFPDTQECLRRGYWKRNFDDGTNTKSKNSYNGNYKEKK